MKTLTGLDGLIWTRTEPPLAPGQLFGIPGGVSSRTSTDLKPSVCVEMIWGRGVFIGDTSQSVSGWWQPVCRFAWLRTHARRHLVLHMSFSMAKTHAGHHHSYHISGCMTETHARRHTISQMSISMLRLHARRHLVLGRSTSCFYMSDCMYYFHARRHLKLLETLSLAGYHTDLKGASASMKLANRGRLTPKKKQLKPSRDPIIPVRRSEKFPRTEVYPSAIKSRKPVSTPGSMVSEKPSSTQI
ncbi:hypothetical protein F2Q70_00002716 [Brassica cretica]|uniref:Uncharacterized protein n=1 Tax=Brassica cretica TaxID=69181 RepID=A0A8S9IPP8_BRACR|nr:hypothetical protein F2Q70_00002716 [Brassica cretica]